MGLETTAARPGGLNRYLEALVRAERDVGLDATALVLGSASDDGALLGAAPPGRPMALQAWSVDRTARRLPRPDLADLHFAGTAAITATVGALRRVPQVVHFQGPWAERVEHAGAGRANVALKRMVERHVYRRARRCITLSSAFADVLVERYGVAPWSVSVLAPGVDLERFTPGGPQPLQVARRGGHRSRRPGGAPPRAAHGTRRAAACLARARRPQRATHSHSWATGRCRCAP